MFSRRPVVLISFILILSGARTSFLAVGTVRGLR